MQGQGRRIAITGLGVVAPCGLGKDAYWTGLLGPGLDGVGRATEIGDWDASPYYDSPKDARRADLSEQFAVAAATEALAQAGELSADPTRIGTIFGTGVGGIHTLEEQIVIRIEKGERRVSPFLVPMMMANAPGAAVSCASICAARTRHCPPPAPPGPTPSATRLASSPGASPTPWSPAVRSTRVPRPRSPASGT